MKYLSMVMFGVCVFVGNAQAAPVSLAKYSYAAAYFGADGATQRPVPVATSIQSAALIYKSLEVPMQANGKKAVGIMIDGDLLGIECLPKACKLTVVTDLKLPPVAQNLTVSFSGTVAELIFSALPKASEVMRPGATTRAVGNLNCARIITGRGSPVYCNVNNVNETSSQMDQLAKSGFPEAALYSLIKAAGY